MSAWLVTLILVGGMLTGTAAAAAKRGMPQLPQPQLPKEQSSRLGVVGSGSMAGQDGTKCLCKTLSVIMPP